MDIDTKEQWMQRFRAYLDEMDSVAAETSEDEGERTDLFSLFVELAALRNEVKLESRQVKSALDEFKGVFATLETSHGQLNAELERSRTTQRELRRAALRPLLVELLELHDRLEAGLRAISAYRPSLLGRLGRRERALIEAMAQGQEISLRRLEQLLNARHVTALAVHGKPLDPHTMRAAEIEQRSDVGNGVVTEELRRGFTWEGDLLRVAEVKVNRHPE